MPLKENKVFWQIQMVFKRNTVVVNLSVDFLDGGGVDGVHGGVRSFILVLAQVHLAKRRRHLPHLARCERF